MDIASFLSPEAVIVNCDAASKRRVFQQVAQRASELTTLSEREVLAALLERERLGTTAMGNGIAIPHARFKALANLQAIFVCLQSPVEFDAPDGRDVDVLFVLLAPAENSAEHLRVMARVSRFLRNSHSCQQIRHAVTREVVYSLLTAEDEESES